LEKMTTKTLASSPIISYTITLTNYEYK